MKNSIPIALGYLAVSFTFGMMASSGGLPASLTVLISMTNLTSAGQVAGIGVIIADGGYFEMTLTQIIINMRYALMSLSLSQRLEKTGALKKALMAFGNTDEIYAVAVSEKDKIKPVYFFGLMILPYCGWTAGTLLGCVAGGLLPGSLISALSIALYSMFIAIIIPPAKSYRPVAYVILIAVAISCMFRFLPLLNRVSSGFAVIISAVTACAVGAALFPVKEAQEDES